MRDGFDRIEERQRRSEQTLNDLATEVMSHGTRIAKLESKATEHSIRARALDERSSSSDLAHEANIAAIRSDVELTKAKVDTILSDIGDLAASVNRIIASPKVKLVASAIVGAVVSYLASRGVQVPSFP